MEQLSVVELQAVLEVLLPSLVSTVLLIATIFPEALVIYLRKDAGFCKCRRHGTNTLNAIRFSLPSQPGCYCSATFREVAH
jgi:hypothetical protein